MAKSAILPSLDIKFPFYEHAGPTALSEQPSDPPKGSEKPSKQWEDLRSHLESRLSQLRAWRYSWWMQNWSDLAEFILPRRSIWLTQSAGGIPTPNNMLRGREINKSIVDPTATYAARICAGGLVSGLVSPSRPWFKVVAGLRRKELDADARRWIDETEDRMYSVIAGTNFYESEAQEKEDVVVFATAPCIIYEDERDIFHCYNPCVGEYYLGTDGSNRHNALYRQFLQTMVQTVDFFGTETPSEEIKKMWKQKGSALDVERIVSHSIEPNFAVGDNDAGIVPGNFTWREVYWLWEAGAPRPLSFRGFHDQPFTVSTWARQSNDPYGRGGPGMDSCPDVMQLQVMTRRLAEAIEKQVRPPLLADMQLKNQPSSSQPGSVTYVPKLGADTGMRSIYNVTPDVKAMAENIAQIEQRIKVSFFNDLFLMLEQKVGDRMTAYEVAQKMNEKLTVLGPVIENMIGVLKLKLKRIYGIMQRRGFIDPPPASLRGIPIDVTFISTLALAQKAAATGGLERLAALIGNMVPIYPEVKNILDAEKYIRVMNDLLGNAEMVIRSPDQYAQINQMQQKAAQTTAAMQAAQHGAQTASIGADAANTLSQTQIGGGANALGILMGQGGGKQ